VAGSLRLTTTNQGKSWPAHDSTYSPSGKNPGRHMIRPPVHPSFFVGVSNHITTCLSDD